MINYNYRKIRDEVYEIVKDASYSEDNKFKSTVWEYHILPVVKHSLTLGKKLGADLEVLELASLLHDYASISNYKYYKKHHIYGARMAGKILEELGFPKQKIKNVQSCILSHRGSVIMRRENIEAKILASADAMSHITEIADIFFLAYSIHGFETKEGCKWIKGKLMRSWQKIMPEGRELVRDDYDLFLGIINKAILKG